MFRIAPLASFALFLPTGGMASPSFDAFVASLHTARAADMSDRTVDATAFEQARAHLLELYDGITVRQTIEQDGRTLDCIRADQQPALRLGTVTHIAAPPALPPVLVLHTAMHAGEVAAKTEKPACAPGTFPMQRLTLERIMRAGSLRAFFRKGPGTAGQAHDPQREDARNLTGHAYVYAYQYAANFGGVSGESLYRPPINTAIGQVFTLEQNWYIGSSGPTTQTAEVGWQVYPQIYNTPKSVLFAYWTADGYATTGCYNYDCGAFVQNPASTVSLGSTFATYSSLAGGQVTLPVGYYFTGGNWWLAVSNQWVGYYPASIYKGGFLSKNASLIEYGTEAVGGTTRWPREGSGSFASVGLPAAAYQRNIAWIDSAGIGHTPSLSLIQPSPSCYTGTAPSVLSVAFGYGFLLGGPGGVTC